MTWDPLLYQVIMNKCPEDQGKVQLESFEPVPEEARTLKIISSTIGKASWYGKNYMEDEQPVEKYLMLCFYCGSSVLALWYISTSNIFKD